MKRYAPKLYTPKKTSRLDARQMWAPFQGLPPDLEVIKHAMIIKSAATQKETP